MADTDSSNVASDAVEKQQQDVPSSSTGQSVKEKMLMYDNIQDLDTS